MLPALRIVTLSLLSVGFGVVFACGDSAGTGAVPEDEGDGGLCLENTCRSDDHCAGCGGGKTTCDASQRRCVACGPAAGRGCPAGLYCTPHGDCVPNGLSCNLDTLGNPSVVCNAAQDCAACDPKHRVCDSALRQCVGCTSADKTKCLPGEACIQGRCAARCPATCKTNVDCMECGAPGFEARSCNAGKCAQCGPGIACPVGARCTSNGVCERPCGVAGKPRGTCGGDSDCAGCEAGSVTCHLPVNGGAGRCGPKAPGCEELGPGLTLPDPWNKVTNFCSNDTSCSNVSVDYNVGKVLRDVTGISSINDAIVSYPMHACASVQILPEKSCGICVPCKEDSHCTPIDVDQVSAQAFGPLGAIATALLIEQVFGPNDRRVHMYCDLVVSDYGYCRPCSNVFSECGVPVAGPASCDHGECEFGGALPPTCNACVGEVCASDPFCCDGENGTWDSTCIEAVGRVCGAACP